MPLDGTRESEPHQRQIGGKPVETQNSVRTLAALRQAVALFTVEHQNYSSTPYLFPSSKTGEMFDSDSLQHAHDKILKVIGEEHIRLHDLRYTAATLSLKNGVDSRTLSGALGYLFGEVHSYHLHLRHSGDKGDTTEKF